MLIASVAYIVGSWFGPVSLAVPTVMISKLLFNLIIMGAVLRMADFPREQRIGTYTIAYPRQGSTPALPGGCQRTGRTIDPTLPLLRFLHDRCAILTLPEIGAKDQKCQDAIHLMTQMHSRVWGGVIALASFACVIGMVVLKAGEQPPPIGQAMAVYVTAQVTSAVVGARCPSWARRTSAPTNRGGAPGCTPQPIQVPSWVFWPRPLEPRAAGAHRCECRPFYAGTSGMPCRLLLTSHHGDAA